MIAQGCTCSGTFSLTAFSSCPPIQRSSRAHLDKNRSSSSRAVVCVARSTRSDDDAESSGMKPPRHNDAAEDRGRGSSADAGQHQSPGGNRGASIDGSPAGSKLHGNAAGGADHSSRGTAHRPGSAASRPLQGSDVGRQQGSSRPVGEADRGGRGSGGGRGGSRDGGRGRDRQASSASSNKGLQPKLLTAAIKAGDSPQQLLQVVQQHATNFNHIHLSAAYTCAVKLCRQGVPLQQQPAAVQQLLHDLAEQLQQQCGARELANIIWSCGRLSDAGTAPMLLPVFLQDSNLQQADPQAVANVLWAAATLQLQLTPQLVQQLLQQFAAQLPQATPQQVSNVLWAVATMQHRVSSAQLQQLLQHFWKVLSQANPQAVANTLWVVATMQQQLPAEQLQGWLQHFQHVLPQATPQAVANTLWALATMQQQVPQGQLQQMLLHFQQVLQKARPQAIANTLWACGQFHYIPLQLLSALEQHPQQLQAVLAAANPQELANMAWACGQLGYRGKLLPGALLQQAVKLLQDSSSTGKLTPQSLCNPCWSAAVLNLQQFVPQVLQLAAASSQLWCSAVAEGLQQLHQVHLWLLDSQLPAPGQGLSGVLSQQQLEQCRASWEQVLATNAQQQVTDTHSSQS